MASKVPAAVNTLCMSGRGMTPSLFPKVVMLPCPLPVLDSRASEVALWLSVDAVVVCGGFALPVVRELLDEITTEGSSSVCDTVFVAPEPSSSDTVGKGTNVGPMSKASLYTATGTSEIVVSCPMDNVAEPRIR